MNILWITNGLLPEATAKLGGATEIKRTGGWVYTLSDALIKKGGIRITIAGIVEMVNELSIIEGECITYYAIPSRGGVHKYNNIYEKYFKEIFDNIKPDVVHIHGTEYPHALAALRACGSSRTLVSIQGMVSVYAPYFMADIKSSEVRRNVTIRSFFRPSLMEEQRDMENRGKYEVETIKLAKYITGRTSWDRDNTWAINPNAAYFQCNRILRDDFYEGNWDYNKCQPHSIFLSQAGLPLKGLHKVIEAMAIVMRKYPDVQLRVAGRDITFSSGKFLDRYRISTYGKIIKKRIKKYHLDNKVKFTGPLNGAAMKEECLRSNVFICPSSIENSPNSLGEAQILGVPCIASYVGGSMDMMKGDEENLYRFEEIGMLAAKICNIFAQEQNIDTHMMRQVALKRHNKDEIVNIQLNIYKKIISENV